MAPRMDPPCQEESRKSLEDQEAAGDGPEENNLDDTTSGGVKDSLPEEPVDVGGSIGSDVTRAGVGPRMDPLSQEELIAVVEDQVVVRMDPPTRGSDVTSAGVGPRMDPPSQEESIAVVEDQVVVTMDPPTQGSDVTSAGVGPRMDPPSQEESIAVVEDQVVARMDQPTQGSGVTSAGVGPRMDPLSQEESMALVEDQMVASKDPPTQVDSLDVVVSEHKVGMEAGARPRGRGGTRGCSRAARSLTGSRGTRGGQPAPRVHWFTPTDIRERQGGRGVPPNPGTEGRTPGSSGSPRTPSGGPGSRSRRTSSGPLTTQTTSR